MKERSQAQAHGSENCTPILSVVITNSDGLELTLGCLASIFGNPPEASFEVILVDNCSQISPIPSVKERYPQVHVFTAPQPQGFARNYNLGMRQARGAFILALNNDTLIHPGSLDALLAAIQSDEGYGMVGPRLLWPDGRVQTVCVRGLPTLGTYIATQFLLDLGLPSGKLWDRQRRKVIAALPGGPVPCLSGACMLVSRSAVEEVGLLDEGYDFYYEDIEWCHRFQKHGFQVAYVPQAEVTHYGDQSLSRVKEWAKKSEYLSALRYFRQHRALSRGGEWLLWLATSLSYLMRAIFFRISELFIGSRGHGMAYIRLFRWMVRQSPVRTPATVLPVQDI